MAESHRDEIAKLEALYAANPEGRVFTHLAEAYRKAGELARARDVLESGLKRHANYSSAHVVLGRVLWEEGQVGEAERAFRRVLELDPQNLIALRALGDLLREAGRGGDALTHYRELLSLDPANEEVEQFVGQLEKTTPAPDAAAAASSTPGLGGAQPEAFEVSMGAAAPGSGATAADAVLETDLGLEPTSFAEPAALGGLEPTDLGGPAGDVELVIEPTGLEPTAQAPVDATGLPLEPVGLEAPGADISPAVAEETGPAGMDLSLERPEESVPSAADLGLGFEPEATPAADLELALAETEGSAEPAAPELSFDAQARAAGSELSVEGAGAELSLEATPPAEAAPVEPAAEAEPALPPEPADLGALAFGTDAAPTEAHADWGAPVEPVGADALAGALGDEVVTETMAELYARQGLHERAAEVYRALLRERPGDERLQRRLDEVAGASAEAARRAPPEPRPAEPAPEWMVELGFEDTAPAFAPAEKPAVPLEEPAPPGLAGEDLGLVPVGEPINPPALPLPAAPVEELESAWTGGGGAARESPSPYDWMEEARAEPPASEPSILEYFRGLIAWGAGAGAAPLGVDEREPQEAEPLPLFMPDEPIRPHVPAAPAQPVPAAAAATDEFDRLFELTEETSQPAGAAAATAAPAPAAASSPPASETAPPREGAEDDDLEMFRAWLQSLKR